MKRVVANAAGTVAPCGAYTAASGPAHVRRACVGYIGALGASATVGVQSDADIAASETARPLLGSVAAVLGNATGVRCADVWRDYYYEELRGSTPPRVYDVAYAAGTPTMTNVATPTCFAAAVADGDFCIHVIATRCAPDSRPADYEAGCKAFDAHVVTPACPAATSRDTAIPHMYRSRGMPVRFEVRMRGHGVVPPLALRVSANAVGPGGAVRGALTSVGMSSVLNATNAATQMALLRAGRLSAEQPVYVSSEMLWTPVWDVCASCTTAPPSDANAAVTFPTLMAPSFPLRAPLVISTRVPDVTMRDCALVAVPTGAVSSPPPTTSPSREMDAVLADALAMGGRLRQGTVEPLDLLRGPPDVFPAASREQVPLVPPPAIPLLSANQFPALSRLQIPRVSDHHVPVLSPFQFPAISAQQVPAVADYDVRRLTPAQTPMTSEYQIQFLWTTQIPLLDGRLVPNIIDQQIPALSEEQIPALEVSRIRLITPWQVAAAAPEQVPNLPASKLAHLTPEQYPVLVPRNIRDIIPRALPLLTSTQVPFVSPQQIPGLSAAQLPGLPPDRLAGAEPALLPILNGDAVPGLLPMFIPLLAPYQIPATSREQVPVILPPQVRALAPNQVGWVAPRHVNNVGGSQVPLLREVQIPVVSPHRVPLIGEDAVPALEPRAIPLVIPSQVPALSPQLVPSVSAPEHVPILTPRQVQAINNHLVLQLEPRHVPLFTPYMLTPFVTPAQWAQVSPSLVPSVSGETVSRLVAKHVPLLTPQQVQFIGEGQVRQLRPIQIPLLEPEQVPNVSPLQLSALSPGQLLHLSSSQIPALPRIPVSFNGGVTLPGPESVNGAAGSFTADGVCTAQEFDTCNVLAWQESRAASAVRATFSCSMARCLGARRGDAGDTGASGAARQSSDLRMMSVRGTCVGGSTCCNDALQPLVCSDTPPVSCVCFGSSIMCPPCYGGGGGSKKGLFGLLGLLAIIPIVLIIALSSALCICGIYYLTCRRSKKRAQAHVIKLAAPVTAAPPPPQVAIGEPLLLGAPMIGDPSIPSMMDPFDPLIYPTASPLAASCFPTDLSMVAL